MGMMIAASCAIKNDNPRELPPVTSAVQESRENIEAYIAAHWEEYGYSEKPAKYIALSFDDGPCSSSDNGGTEALLEALDAAKVKATFFVIGRNVRANQAAARAIFIAGHELGSHSDGYDSLGSKSVDEITTSLGAASWAMSEITGKDPVLFRAPNLNHGKNLSQVCAEKGLSLIDGMAHNDWPGSSAAIKNSVLAGARDGGIIILHENNTSQGNTLAVLPDIVKGLREQGFWIMTVSDLAIVKGITLKAGVRYGMID
jgi:peptidoglycan/xylan/chitin deacetylase (PgdA/CDA1 family)